MVTGAPRPCCPAQELLPTPVRGTGAGAAAALNLVLSSLETALFLPVVRTLGAGLTFLLLAALTAAGLTVVMTDFPETNGAPGDGRQEKPSRVYASYSATFASGFWLSPAGLMLDEVQAAQQSHRDKSARVSPGGSGGAGLSTPQCTLVPPFGADAPTPPFVTLLGFGVACGGAQDRRGGIAGGAESGLLRPLLRSIGGTGDDGGESEGPTTEAAEARNASAASAASLARLLPSALTNSLRDRQQLLSVAAASSSAGGNSGTGGGGGGVLASSSDLQGEENRDSAEQQRETTSEAAATGRQPAAADSSAAGHQPPPRPLLPPRALLLSAARGGAARQPMSGS